ncbi:MAG: transposase [Mariniphaga sp.]|nr:transposase [Mariniphaga sp.]
MDEKTNKRQKRTEENRVYHVREWETSRLTISEYSRRHGIHPSVLSRWIKKFTTAKQAESFIRVDTEQFPSFNTLHHVELLLPGGITLRFESGVIPAIVNNILKTSGGF